MQMRAGEEQRMELAEHFYRDDPSNGPPDVRTNLEGVNYFFLGNGLIQAAVQVCTSGQGTPLGLLIMHPERLGPKRSALTFDIDAGLEPTMVTVRVEMRSYQPQAAYVDARWTDIDGVPAVQVVWRDDALVVDEFFWCPERPRPRLFRELRVRKSTPGDALVTLETGSGVGRRECERTLEESWPASATLRYELEQLNGEVRLEVGWCDSASTEAESAACWNSLADCTFGTKKLDHLFNAARSQLPAMLAASGVMDGGIWQYNLEWVRDQSVVASALAMLGAAELARTMLARLLSRFVGEGGDTVDSGRRRRPADVELDQNGYLLGAIEAYVNWTGDAGILREHWPSIRALAEFPLRETFRHGASGLLHNQRGYWERHGGHGICDGMELTHQLFVSLGLSSAARVARLGDHEDEAERWEHEGARIKQAMLADERFSLIDDGHFIKRRDVSGAVQEEITSADAGLPAGVPLLAAGPHYLNPDTSSALPIALEFVDPRGAVASRTLQQIERLWNQRWAGGGYGRYDVTSEPDSPGPWPFPSLFVARAYFEAGDDEKVERVLDWLSAAPGGKYGAWFEFYGPRPVPPCPQIGIIPWTWAELLLLFIHHLLGVRPGYDELVLRPRLLAGMQRAEGRLRLRGYTLNLAVRRGDGDEDTGFLVDGHLHPSSDGELRLPMPERDLRVEVVTGP